MKFDYNTIDLPVKDVIPDIQKRLAESSTLIVKAPPGAGKSTLVPLALLKDIWLKDQKILMLEPRRLAAKTIATRMANLLGESVGETVGYRIRFDTKVSSNTKLEVLTEGILTRMIHQDNGLEGIGLIIFDEFHERSIHADVAMALCREAQQVLRSDLRILVMSATLDMPELSRMLNAEVVESLGRQYPVEVEYSGESDIRLLPDLVTRVVESAMKKHDGDALVFLPGQGEIKKCEEILKKTLKGVQIHPLYGQLPHAKQMNAIFPDKEGRRKVVLATNIAETSLTIEGIKIVVDSGFARTATFDPNSGLSRLETVKISKDSADQRTGRAGRLTKGVCYRMWTLATQNQMSEHGTPEIEQADLASLMLDMAQWDITDPSQLTWLSPPPRSNVAKATDLLHELEALAHNRITAHGKQLHKLPTHPRIAHMLIKAEESGQLPLATDIAPLLEERDPLNNEAGIDINIRIEALRRFRRDKAGSNRFSRIEKLAAQYRKMFSIEPENSPVEDYETGLLLAYCYPERIAHARPGNNAQYQMANGKIAAAGHKDDLAHEPWLAIAHVNDRQGMGKVFMASPVDPRDLSSMVKTREVITWDTKNGGLIATKDTRIGRIVLQSIPLPEPDESKLTEAITDAIQKEGRSLLNWNEEVEQWQNRVLSLKKWYPEDGWPDVSVETLLSTNAEWLSPYIVKVRKAADLKKIDLKEVLYYSLETSLQKKLEQLAPTKVNVPSGSSIKLNYQASGSAPILAVRLQECFGLESTPMVNSGQTGVLMHLLSPGYKIVQITSDLKSFWANTYFDVRKDLRQRYKKHYWPANPTEAIAFKGTKRQNNIR